MTATAPLEGEEGEAILAAAEARSVSRAPCRELLAFGLHKESQRKCDIAHTLQRPACEDCDRNCTKNVQLRSQSSPNRRRGAVFTAATSELRQFDPQPAATRRSRSRSHRHRHRPHLPAPTGASRHARSVARDLSTRRLAITLSARVSSAPSKMDSTRASTKYRDTGYSSA